MGKQASPSASSKGKVSSLVSSKGTASPYASSKGKASPYALPWDKAEDRWVAKMSQLDSKAGMHVSTRWFKLALNNAGAAPTLGDCSVRVRAEQLKLAAQVLRTHNLFGLRTAVDAAMTDKEFRKVFGHLLKTVLTMEAKVALSPVDF